MNTLRRVYNGKYTLIKNERNSWPRYLNYSEDLKLRGDYWNKRYEGCRVVQWDNTNIPIGNPSGIRKQRTIFSSYYSDFFTK